MRYTQYNRELERYVVPCLFKPDGSEISFSVITGETYLAENGAGVRYPIGKDPDLVFGEVIDRLAELENEKEVQHDDSIKEARAEAIKEFAAVLVDRLDLKHEKADVYINDDYIARIVEEMTEEQR